MFAPKLRAGPSKISGWTAAIAPVATVSVPVPVIVELTVEFGLMTSARIDREVLTAAGLPVRAMFRLAVIAPVVTWTKLVVVRLSRATSPFALLYVYRVEAYPVGARLPSPRAPP